MIPQAPQRKRRNSSKVNLLISLVFHSVILLGLFYFAAREGLLGKQLKKIAVEMVKQEPEKPKEPEPEPEKIPEPELQPEQPVLAETPRVEAPPTTVAAPPPANTVTAPPAVAPPSASVPSFVFEGGRAVQSSSDPVQLYKGSVEYALRSKWDRPVDIADRHYVAEVEVSVDRDGRIGDPTWKRGSGDPRWDASVRAALAATPRMTRRPPTNFPSRILIRFDVQEEAEFSAPIPLSQ
jgi:outer membrane biosynthesis protein TonB